MQNERDCAILKEKVSEEGMAQEMEKIFVIEDDENIRNLIRVALEGYGYTVRLYESAEDALAQMERERPDLAVFDWMLPGMDGLTAIREIRRREEENKLPILILTAKDKEYDKVEGLDGGADDYMTKPFGVLELAARVRSLLRRSRKTDAAESGRLEAGLLQVDKGAREVRAEGRPVVLTYKEYELLLYLWKNASRVVTREELLDRLWDYNAEVETRTLDIHIKTLRHKLGPACGGYIRTVRSVGYRFQTEDPA